MNDKVHSVFGSKPIIWIPAWAISKLRKRTGKYAAAIEGEGEWFDDWYARFMSQSTVDMLADLGVNLVALPFSLGASEATERAEREDFERMTAMLHQRDILSVPYIQYQNILQEVFELPGAPWGVNLDGSPKQFAYWRRTVCQSAPAFIDYLKGLISDAVRRGADGVWIDNTHLAPCRCDCCQGNFKEWLTRNRADLLDDLYFDDFSRVEIPRAIGATFDPIVRALIEFNCERNLGILRTLKAHLESLKPNGLFASNPGLYRIDSLNGLYGKGIDYYQLVSLHDFMYLENKFFPGFSDGQTTGNYHGLIATESCGSMGIPGGWKHGDFDETGVAMGTHTSGFPSTAEEIRRALFEAVAFGGAISMVWSIRGLPERLCSSPDDLMRFYIEHPSIMEPTREALTFLRPLPVFGASQNRANIAVLRHRNSLAYNGPWSWPAVHAAEEMLQQNGLPFDVLFSEDFAARAAGYAVIILPEVAVLSDEDTAHIANYVADGGRILVLGNAGIYTERMKTRREFSLHSVTGVSRFRRPADFVFTTHGKGLSGCLPLCGPSDIRINNAMHKTDVMYFPRWHTPGTKEKVTAALLKLLGSDRQIAIQSPALTAASARRTEDGRTAIHLLSYTMHPGPQTVTIDVHNSLIGAQPPEWHTPDFSVQTPSETPQGATPTHSRFVLDGFRDYGVLLV